MSEKQEELIQTALRVPESLLERIDKIAESMSRDGIRITRADVLRSAVFRGIEQLETEKKKR